MDSVLSQAAQIVYWVTMLVISCGFGLALSGAQFHENKRIKIGIRLMLWGLLPLLIYIVLGFFLSLR